MMGHITVAQGASLIWINILEENKKFRKLLNVLFVLCDNFQILCNLYSLCRLVLGSKFV